MIATDVSLPDIREEMIDALGESDVVRLTDDYLYRLYGIETEDLAEAAAFMLPRDIFQEEIILTKARDEASLARIREMLGEHLDAIRDQSRDYDPATYAIVQKSTVKTDGLYAWLLISARQEELDKLFSSHRKAYAPEEAPVYATAAPTQAPTAAPTPEATQAPAAKETADTAATEEPAPEATPVPFGLVPESEPVEDAWWDDAIIIGNSVAKNLENYVTKQRLGDDPDCMGKAVFFTAGSYTYKNAALHTGNPPKLQGRTHTLEDAIAVTGAKKAFISMGQGDMVFFQRPMEEVLGYVDTVVQSVQANTPEVTIYLLGVTPRAAQFEGQFGDNAMLREFNEGVCRIAEERGCYYIDCYEALADDAGCLSEEYCAETYDGGIHLTDAGCAVWLDCLYRHTAG